MEDIEVTVRAWDAMMRTFPTFEEIRDVEFIRRGGTINMITDNVQRALYDQGRLDGVLWIQRCRDHNLSWHFHYATALSHYTKIHGPSDQWFNEELLHEWETECLLREERELRSRLSAVTGKIRKITQKGSNT